MSELRDFAALQAKVFEFVAQQDEAALRAIVDGTAKLAVLHADETPATHPSPSPAPAASPDPLQTAQDLPRLGSAQERRSYLKETGLNVAGLRRVAKLLDLHNYSKLDRTSLENLLIGHDQPIADEPRASAPSAINRPTGAAQPNGEAGAIASRLREIETEEEGAVYLDEQNLDRDGLLAVAAELQLTRVNRLSQKDLRRRVLKQAIGARRKFAGLRTW